MLRLLAAGVGGVLLSTILLSSNSTIISAADKKDEIPSIEEIMQKLNKPKTLHKVVGKAIEADTINWADVATMTKQYAELAGALGKHKCPKGSADSWAKLCKSYADDAKALDVAAGKKDKAAAATAWGKLNKSCQGCHDEHR